LGNGELFCKDLTKVYADSGGKKALDSINLTVPSHGIFSLIGMNGAGKTTLVRILATNLEPTSGIAMIDGIDVVKEARKLREKIAIIPQEARTIPWMTPRQGVFSYLLWRGLGYAEARKRTSEALAKLGLEEKADELNRKLSGGQRRKVMVATVLAADTEITFLDEPTTGLDPISRRELWKSLQEIAKDRFLVLTTHYLEEAEQLADVIGILDKGKLVALGSIESLRGMVKYQYSIRIPSETQVPSIEDGIVTTGRRGQIQILTNDKEAYRLSQEFFEKGTKFSVNRMSLDDVFFHLVRSDVEEMENG
jgi:ABC-2 type transport system ATP-binding protein